MERLVGLYSGHLAVFMHDVFNAKQQITPQSATWVGEGKVFSTEAATL